MEILFGFERSAFTDKLLNLLAQRGVDATGAYRASKIAVKEYLRQNKDCNTVVLREFSDAAQYMSNDLMEIADIRDELNIVVVLDGIHRGTSYMQDLLSAGIRNAVFQERKGVSSAEVVDLVLNKRSREEAWKYYGLTTVGAMSQNITQQKYNDCVATLEDTSFGENLGERYKAVVADMTPLQNADFLTKLRVYHKILFRELSMYREYYDVVDFLTEEGIRLPFRVKRPRKLLSGKKQNTVDETSLDIEETEKEKPQEAVQEETESAAAEEQQQYTEEELSRSLDDLFDDSYGPEESEEEEIVFENFSEDDFEEETAGETAEEGAEDMSDEDIPDEDVFSTDPLLVDYESEETPETAPVMKKSLFSKKAEKASTGDFDHMESFFEKEDVEKKNIPITAIIIIALLIFILFVFAMFYVSNTLSAVNEQARERQRQEMTSMSANEFIKEDAYATPQNEIASVEEIPELPEKQTPKKITVTKVTKEELSAQMQSAGEMAEEFLEEQTNNNAEDMEDLIGGSEDDEEDEEDIPVYSIDGEEEDDVSDTSSDTTDDSADTSDTSSASGSSASAPGTNNLSSTSDGSTSVDSGGGTAQEESGGAGDDTEVTYTQINSAISFNYEPKKKESSFDGKKVADGDILTGVEVINYINSRNSGTFYIVYEQETIKVKAKKATAANVPSQITYEVLIKNGKTSFIAD